MSSHASLPDIALHEPKGVASASANTFYKANGAGTGSWVKPLVTQLDTTGGTSGQVYKANGTGAGSWETVNNKNLVCINVQMTDIGTAASTYVVIPISGRVTKAYSVVGVATSGGATVLTLLKNGTPLTSGTITVASGSVAGTVDDCSPVNDGVSNFTAGQALEISSDGGTSSTSPASITVVVDVS